MNADQKIRFIIGDLVIANAMLTHQLEEAKKENERLKLSQPNPAFEEPR